MLISPPVGALQASGSAYAATGITTAVYFPNLALQRTRDFFALLIVPAVSGLFLYGSRGAPSLTLAVGEER